MFLPHLFLFQIISTINSRSIVDWIKLASYVLSSSRRISKWYIDKNDNFYAGFKL